MVLLDLQAMDIRALPSGHGYSVLSMVMCPSENSIQLCWRSDLSVMLCA